MPYINFTREQKQRAAGVDLEQLLLSKGEKLIRCGPDKRLASDHSVTVRGNEWFDWATRRGGGPVTFVQQFYGLSYVDAMTLLLDGEQGQVFPAARERQKEPPKPFELPPPNKDMRRVYAYLLKQRHIDRNVISHFAREGTLYEDAQYHNAVFAGKDERGVFCHAHKRSTNTRGRTFRINVEGSDPRCSFHHFGSDDQLYVFEAPIDILSFISLHMEGWEAHSYVALCGTSDIAMRWMLEQKPELRDVALCLDHDEAGIEASMKHSETLRELGYAPRILRPHCKDWNENLKELHGLPAQPGEEHPQLMAAGPICVRIGQRSAGVDGVTAPERIPLLLKQYAIHLREGQTDQALGCMETASALALSAAAGKMRLLGQEGTPERWVEYLCQRIQPHKNRESLTGRDKALSAKLREIAGRSADSSPAALVESARAWLDFAASCAMVPVYQEGKELKERLKQEKKQAREAAHRAAEPEPEPEPAMAGMSMGGMSA